MAEPVLVFSKDTDGAILCRDIDIPNIIPFRAVNLNSKTISCEGDIFEIDFNVLGNKNKLAPGVYKVLFAQNLSGLDECSYQKIENLHEYPLLNDLNNHWDRLFNTMPT